MTDLKNDNVADSMRSVVLVFVRSFKRSSTKIQDLGRNVLQPFLFRFEVTIKKYVNAEDDSEKVESVGTCEWSARTDLAGPRSGLPPVFSDEWFHCKILQECGCHSLISNFVSVKNHSKM